MQSQKKNILVTGANGFIGKHLCRAFSNLGFVVTGLVKAINKLDETYYHPIAFDISDNVALQNIFSEVRPDYVVHLAASTERKLDLSSIKSLYEINLFGSLNILKAIQNCSTVDKFIFLGSCEEYGDYDVVFEESLKESPQSVYGISKLAITQLLRQLVEKNSFSSLILRPSVVYGPGQKNEMFLPSLINSLLRGNKYLMSNGEQTRDFIFIDDLIRAITSAILINSDSGMVINISSGESLALKEVADTVASLVGLNSSSLIKFGAIDYRFDEIMKYSVNNSRARETLNWAPQITLRNGLAQTVEHYKRALNNNINEA